MNKLNRPRTLVARLLAAWLFLPSVDSALTAVRYVDVNSANPVQPYTSWASAATNIQDAVDAAVAGDEIVVTNGIYAIGGRAVYGTMTNRVAVNKPLTVRSVNGPQFTIIQGRQVPGSTNGDGAIRCVYLTNGASMSGFSLTNGATRTAYDYPTYRESSGGGVWCESTNTVVVSNCVVLGNSANYGGGAYAGTLINCTLAGNSADQGGGAYFSMLNNCTVSSNSAPQYGGGAYGGMLNNCTVNGNYSGWGGGGAFGSALNGCILSGNSAQSYGGGTYDSTLNNCTLTGNSALQYGGGAYGGTLSNCIVYFNRGQRGESANYDSSTLNYCCTTPQPTNGVGNISANPQLASASHLSAASACRGAGSAAYTAGTDIDGEAWASPPSIGCDEYHVGAVTGPLNVGVAASFTTVATGFPVQFTALIEGRTTASVWDFGDGIMVTNQPYSSHTWGVPGDYAVVLRAYNESQPIGISATVTAQVVTQPVHYVAAGSPRPIAPYTSWSTAAGNIQDAVDAATEPGALVLVANGIYSFGGRVVGVDTNRVAIEKPLTVQSVNGPQFTSIHGTNYPGSGIRCVYLTDSATLSGFTLANGASYWSSRGGGGAYGGTLTNCTLTGNASSAAIYSTLNNCTLTNNWDYQGGGARACTLNGCTLAGNTAYDSGGGASLSTLNDCTLIGNSADQGGGAAWCTLNRCTLKVNSVRYGGGGATSCTLNNCTFMGNSAEGGGGGAQSSTLNNCMLTGNSASYGAGTSSCTLNNCTLTGNSAQYGGGAASCTLNNCIVYFNTSPHGSNYDPYSTLNYCCATPQPTNGIGNITVDPQLATASHLSAASLCRGAGSGAYTTGADIDGESWARPPSIGCDEYGVGAVTGPLNVAITASFTTVATGFVVQFAALIEGRTIASVWDFGDGTEVTNQPYRSHAWGVPGDYAVVLRVYNESHPVGITALVAVHVVDEVHYVAMGSPNPVAPYTSWSTAAGTIQDAVDAANVPGALVLVTNGIYADGGRAAGTNLLPNRVAIDKPLTLRSVKGPQFTMIQGHQVPSTINGDGAIRCVYLAKGSTLSGFTLTNGATLAVYDYPAYRESSGGGVWCESADTVVVSNCVIVGNSASYCGGGVYRGTLNNCTLAGNSSSYGGGMYEGALNNCVLAGNLGHDYGGAVYYATLNNCTLTGNSAQYGGGAASCTLNNCIVYFNTARHEENYAFSTLNYCCTTPLPGSGVGNIVLDPQLVSVSHLIADSPCHRAGSAAFVSGSDIDGETWASPPSIGCDEYHVDELTGPLRAAITASYTNVATSFAVHFTGWIEGRVAASSWDFGDGTMATNQPYTSHAWRVPGDYAVVLRAYNESQSAGISATTTVHVVAQPVHYVAVDSASPVPPYSNWATAATNIQEAVDASEVPGALVLVTNGIYSTGGRALNRVAVDKPLVLRSVNGPEFTIIDGGGLVRCIYLTSSTRLTGFTLTNGVAWPSGGGVYCESPAAAVSNCVIAGNWATSGGGASGGQLNNCVLSDNQAFGYDDEGGGPSGSGGGARDCAMNNCTLEGNFSYNGGGVDSSTLNNCRLTGNSGGGAHYSTLNNCMLTGNSGGGAHYSTLNNCTLTGNSFGASFSALNNCIVYFNTGAQDANYDFSSTLNYSCTAPQPTNGVGNISLDPQLTSASHLSAVSPCRGAGSAAYASGTDVDGETWGKPPSIGCDEYHAGAVTGPLSVAIAASFTYVQMDFTVQLTALIEGRTTASFWDFGDGTVATNQPYTSHAWTALGDYAVVLRVFNESQPGGISATVTVHVVAQPVHYVAVDSANPVAPYASWATAATNIQGAVDAAAPGAHVLVTNGIYAPVTVGKPLTLRSLNGPQFTVINGGHSNRCVYLSSGASLSSFTLTNGFALYGGGLWCESTNAVVSNCVVSGNSSFGHDECGFDCYYVPSHGGGVYGGTLNNCILSHNSAEGYSWVHSGYGWNSGGGASGATLNNCTISYNRAASGAGVSGCILNNCIVSDNYGTGAGGSTLNNCTLTGNSGGGAQGSTLYNCIVYFNTASGAWNYDPYSTLDYCCTTPQPTNGVGNISENPQLASASHLSEVSPCRGAGSPAYAGGTDIDGEPWAGSPSIGCDEYHEGAVTGPLIVGVTASFTNVLRGFAVQFTAVVGGRTTLSAWDFGDGTMATNQPYTSHAWTALGDYVVTLRAYNESQPRGISVTVTVQVVEGVYYVAARSPNPVPPYTSWATAATNIQDAIDAVVEPGAIVLATNGVYAYGSRLANAATNRVVIEKPLTLRSVNGPLLTVIDGGQSNRCVYLANGANVSDFTLTQGAAVYGGGAYGGTLSNCVLNGNSAEHGGGAHGSTLLDCTLTGNSAGYNGGGAEYCTLNDCILSANSADFGGGAYGSNLKNCIVRGNSADYGGGVAGGSTLLNCTLTTNTAYFGGGGASVCTLTNCALSGNSARYAGGAGASTLYNCTLSGNRAAGFGGGATQSSLNNCTLTGNSAADFGGAAQGSTLNNCIVYFNTAARGPNYDPSTTVNYSCTTPQPTNGVGNISTAPLFADPGAGNLRLQFNSPCINAGNDAIVTTSTDLDGRPRILGGAVDIGAYEYQPGLSGVFIGWLHQFGLPTDGSADFTDADHDGMNNWQEWAAGTVPSNSTSALRLLSPVLKPAGLQLRWSSDINHAYFIQRATNLEQPLAFSLLRTNVPGLSGTTTYIDTTPPSTGAAFYRIGTDSTNAASPLWLQAPVFVPASVVVSWTSVANRSYFLERASNLAPPMQFIPVATNIPGQLGTTTFISTNAVGSGPFFYRVGVRD